MATQESPAFRHGEWSKNVVTFFEFKNFIHSVFVTSGSFKRFTDSGAVPLIAAIV
jgi:hypothetical protein